MIVLALTFRYLTNRGVDTATFKRDTKAARIVTQAATAEVARIAPAVISTRRAYATNRASVLANNPTAREVVSFQTSDATLLATDSLATAQKSTRRRDGERIKSLAKSAVAAAYCCVWRSTIRRYSSRACCATRINRAHIRFGCTLDRWRICRAVNRESRTDSRVNRRPNYVLTFNRS